jgi:hypothetical protein
MGPSGRQEELLAIGDKERNDIGLGHGGRQRVEAGGGREKACLFLDIFSRAEKSR